MQVRGILKQFCKNKASGFIFYNHNGPPAPKQQHGRKNKNLYQACKNHGVSQELTEYQEDWD